MNKFHVALVVGIANYPKKPLTNPVNDANDIAASLETLGFQVVKQLDCSYRELCKALQDFKSLIYESQATVGLFFFAGHGIQIGGKNFLITIDSEDTSANDLEHTSLSLDRLIGTMNEAHLPAKIIILDACRNNPYERSLARSGANQGLAPINAPQGTLIAYATSPGQIALDGVNGKNGAYTNAILEHIQTPDLSIEDMFKRVRNTLSVATKQGQISWEHTSLAGDFFFNQSLGSRIDIYKSTSISDSLFILNLSRASHHIISELKTSNWHRQNPAIDQLASKAGRFTDDSLFVIGRNIYQAACGGSRTASEYIKKFMSHTAQLRASKRKAILDGILFEIFFNSKGELRYDFKDEYFNEAFDLQRHVELRDSFEFISECLNTYSYRFYTIPGKGVKTSIDIEIDVANGNRVIGVYLGSNDLLRGVGELPVKYKNMDCSDFESMISDQMFIPMYQLTITYIPSIQKSVTINFPRNWTVKNS